MLNGASLNWWNVWKVNMRKQKVSENARKGSADWKPDNFRSLNINWIYKLR
jgi:hypothetical protein